MICSIKNWLSENKVDMNVYLVDRVNDFINVIEWIDFEREQATYIIIYAIYYLDLKSFRTKQDTFAKPQTL